MHKWINRLLYVDTLRSAWNKKKLMLYLLIADLLALFILLKAIPAFDMLFYKMNIINIVIYIVIMYLGIVPIIYSFFKYCVLDFTRSITDRKRFTLKRFWQFYALNLKIVLLPILTITLFLFLISITIEQKYAALVFGFMMTPLLFFYYPFLQIAHSLFYKGENKIIKTSFKKTFSWKILIPIISAVIILAIYALITLAISPLITYTLFRSQAIYDALYETFQSIYTMFTLAILALLHSLNRVYFYNEFKDKEKEVLSTQDQPKSV